MTNNDTVGRLSKPIAFAGHVTHNVNKIVIYLREIECDGIEIDIPNGATKEQIMDLVRMALKTRKEDSND